MSEFLNRIIKKIFSVLADIAIFLMGLLFMIFGLGYSTIEHEPTIGLPVIGIGMALAAVGTRKLWRKSKDKQEQPEGAASTPSIDLDDIETGGQSKLSSANELARERYDKAVADYNELNSILRQLQDPGMRIQLKKMQDIANRMIHYLENHPEKLSLADQFINYYQDRALYMSKQFLEFEQLKLNTPDIAAIKAKTRATLDSFDEAYEAQFSRMVSDKVLEMESELKVADQIISDSGIQNTNGSRQGSRNTATTGMDIPELKQNTAAPFSIERPFDIKEPEYTKQDSDSGKRGWFRR